jgi:hypothetical protein
MTAIFGQLIVRRKNKIFKLFGDPRNEICQKIHIYDVFSIHQQRKIVNNNSKIDKILIFQY